MCRLNPAGRSNALRTRILAIFSGAAFTIGVILIGVAYGCVYAFELRAPGTACLQRNPGAGEVHSGLSQWPLGLKCIYGAGSRTTIVESGWGATVVMLLGIALMVAGLVLLVSYFAARRAHRNNQSKQPGAR
jgi:hypothetical protein